MDDFLKNPKKATLYYREESLRAIAAGQKAAARLWRLAGDAANQVVRQGCGNSILVPIQMPFVENFTEFSLSLQKIREVLKKNSDQKKSDFIFEDDFSQEIFSHYRYWMNCLVVSCSYHFEREIMQLVEVIKKYQKSFSQAAKYAEQAFRFFKIAQEHQQHQIGTSSIQEELLVAHWVSTAYEAAHIANIDVQHAVIAAEKNFSLLESWKTMRHYAKQTLSLRLKSAEASKQREEKSAIEYSLAALAMNDAAENMIRAMKGVISKNESLAVEWQAMLHLPNEIVEKRVAIAISQEPDVLLQNAASWLDAAWEADLKRVEAIAQEYYLLASYWQESRDFSRRIAELYRQATLKKKNRFSFVSYVHQVKLNHLEKKAQKKIPIMFMEEIFFCMPEDYFPDSKFREKWEKGGFTHFVEDKTSLTTNAWLYQTGVLLQQSGVKCHFYIKMPHLPCRGILITMSGFLYGYPKKLTLPPPLFIADIAADDGIPRPVAMCHLIPNRHTTKYLPFSEFIPHWSQPFLIPRNEERRDRFETICFMGSSQSIASELRSQEWHERLDQELGLRFIYRDFDCWHDFSDIDCIVAIRDFSGRRFCYKPAHKLHNAWLAGVPFIGGRDSAYLGDGHPGEDYLIANSVEEVFEHLKKLKEDPVFRSQLVERGRQAGANFTREAILQSWKRLVRETLPVRAQKWYWASAARRSFVKVLQRWSCAIQNFIYKHYKPKKYNFVSGKKPDLFAWASNPN